MKILKVDQTLLPLTVSYLMDPKKLPVVDLKAPRFITDIFALKDKDSAKTIHLITAIDRAATKLLESLTRNALNTGPMLRESHAKIGVYLTTHDLTDLIGLETYPMKHDT
jgi:hypothetical protein